MIEPEPSRLTPYERYKKTVAMQQKEIEDFWREKDARDEAKREKKRRERELAAQREAVPDKSLDTATTNAGNVPDRVDDFVLNSGGDRLFDSLGSARVNQADEFNFIIDDLTSNGVEISYRKNALAYGPSASPGTPGTIVLDPDASISAIRHEYGHFLDDKALGFPPSSVYYENPSLRVASERRQYLQEISTAREVGDNTARRALIEDYLEERQYIIDNFYQTPYGQ